MSPFRTSFPTAAAIALSLICAPAWADDLAAPAPLTLEELQGYCPQLGLAAPTEILVDGQSLRDARSVQDLRAVCATNVRLEAEKTAQAGGVTLADVIRDLSEVGRAQSTYAAAVVSCCSRSMGSGRTLLTMNGRTLTLNGRRLAEDETTTSYAAREVSQPSRATGEDRAGLKRSPQSGAVSSQPLPSETRSSQPVADR